MVEYGLPKPGARVRFPLPAPFENVLFLGRRTFFMLEFKNKC